LHYASEYPGDVDALVLLAPYLGYAPIIGEIATAGGVRQWQPSREGAGADHERALWLWLQRCVTSELGLPPIYLGYGEDDKFAPANRLLAELLPPERVFTTAGGHDWRTWKQLWDMFIRARSERLA